MAVKMILATLIALFPLIPSGVNAETDAALVEAGRRIYELGILPDNTPLRAQRAEGFSFEGAQAACTTCHRRSGMGSIEGIGDRVVLVPPVAAPVLFKPARFAKSYLDSAHHYVPNKAWERSLTRPAYDDKTLASALREGLDSAGRPLSPPMMTYKLDKKAMAALAAYLHQLNNQPTPGLIQGRLHVATVITPDVGPEQAESILGVVRVWTKSMRPLSKPVQLHEWRLKGDASDWSRQLASFYRQQPVFALLSGVGGSRWQPVQQFCEAQSVLCILPSVDVVPEEKQQPYYSVYYSSGVTLEARLLAQYLQTQSGKQKKPARLVQVYSDASGKIAAQTLRRYPTFARQASLERRLRITSPSSALSGLSAKDSVMLWLRPDEIRQLVSHWKSPPVQKIYLSALLAPPGSVALPVEWKQRVAYVSLYDDLSVQGEIARVRLKRWLRQHHLPETDLRLQADAYAACYLFNTALARIRKQEIRRPSVPVSREHVLEMLETLLDKYSDGTTQVDPDSHVAFYGRMSLGPLQRFAVRGGNIQRYQAPDYRRLVADSERIVPR